MASLLGASSAKGVLCAPDGEILAQAVIERDRPARTWSTGSPAST